MPTFNGRYRLFFIFSWFKCWLIQRYDVYLNQGNGAKESPKPYIFLSFNVLTNKETRTLETLFNKLKQAVEIQEAKTHDTQLIWVGSNNDFVNFLVVADELDHLQDDTYLILVGYNYTVFNKGELTEDLVNEIKNGLGI